VREIAALTHHVRYHQVHARQQQWYGAVQVGHRTAGSRIHNQQHGGVDPSGTERQEQHQKIRPERDTTVPTEKELIQPEQVERRTGMPRKSLDGSGGTGGGGLRVAGIDASKVVIITTVIILDRPPAQLRLDAATVLRNELQLGVRLLLLLPH